MKKSLLISVLFTLLFTTTAFGDFGEGCDTISDLKKKYVCLRFIDLTFNGSRHILDLKDVSMVHYDKGATSAWKFYAGTHYDPTNSILEFRDKWWLHMKNGKTFRLDSNDKIKIRFRAFLQFIHNHPEFLNMP